MEQFTKTENIDVSRISDYLFFYQKCKHLIFIIFFFLQTLSLKLRETLLVFNHHLTRGAEQIIFRARTNIIIRGTNTHTRTIIIISGTRASFFSHYNITSLITLLSASQLRGVKFKRFCWLISNQNFFCVFIIIMDIFADFPIDLTK